MKKKSSPQHAPTRRSPWLALILKGRRLGEGGFFNPRVLLASLVMLAGVFVVLLGPGTLTHASAQANTDQAPKAQQFGETTVIPALHSDLSRPLRDQPLIWPPTEPEYEANLNLKIPYEHQDNPDPVLQSSFWRIMIGLPEIPSPILQWAGIPNS